MRALVRDLRTWRFWRDFSTEVLAAVGFLVVLLEALDFIAGQVPIKGWPLGLAIAVLSIGYGSLRAWPRPIRQEYSAPRTKIEILRGDLFDQDCNIVVGTCDTFDTEVPAVIARSSVQGEALWRLYGGDVSRLDNDIQLALEGKDVVDTVAKAGKTLRYRVGTVATLRNASHRLYLLAYSKMSARNEAQSTPDLVWRSLESLWEEVSLTSNGSPVAIPVIGGGQSRLSQVMPAQDSIRFIVMSFMFASRTKKVCDELRVVVRDREFDRLDRLELQAFLSSLRAS